MRRLVALVPLALVCSLAIAVGQAAHTTLTVRRVLLGHSVQGRPITARVLGDPNAPVTAVVVGNVHGDEPGGFAVVHRLRRWRPPAGTALWLVHSFNPDGTAARTRQNAHGVDLNRNFPFHW